MVLRNLVSRLALVVLVLITVVAVGCSSGDSKPNNNPNPTPTPTPTNITGTVFLDEDGDGLKGAAETTGIANIVVSNGVTATTTGVNGGFELPKEGSFVFVTVPNTHSASGLWYRSVSGTQFDFGLKLAPAEKSGDSFTFIHLTDIHLDDANLATFNKAVAEFNTISPAFIVNTGDIVNEGEVSPAITISEAQATEWFGKYKTAISGLTVYNAVGNHDCANLACETTVGAAGCSKNVFRNNFGPTYYSFDWGQYHCVVLDPNNGVSSSVEIFSITGSQLEWLQKDLSYRAKNSPLLVFCHEATSSWRSQNTVLSLLKEYKTKIFAGHAHQDLLMDSQGIPEQVTAALSGEWGHGDNLDGSKPGYRVVSVAGSVLDDFYKEIDSTQQIEISPAGATWPIVSGQVELVAKVFTGSGTVSGVTYSVDNATAVDMTLTTGAKWVTATATWDTGSLTPDYYDIIVTAAGSGGASQIEEEVKVSTDPTQPITAQELHEHLRTYQGHYVTVQGTVEMAMLATPLAPAGAGGAVIADSTGRTLIYAGECHNPALTPVETNNTVRVRVIPLRFTWAFMSCQQDREGTYEQFTLQEGFTPAGQKEDVGATKVARWYMRLVTASDMTIL